MSSGFIGWNGDQLSTWSKEDTVYVLCCQVPTIRQTWAPRKRKKSTPSVVATTVVDKHQNPPSSKFYPLIGDI
jgi:hypothetical protein